MTVRNAAQPVLDAASPTAAFAHANDDDTSPGDNPDGQVCDPKDFISKYDILQECSQIDRSLGDLSKCDVSISSEGDFTSVRFHKNGPGGPRHITYFPDGLELAQNQLKHLIASIEHHFPNITQHTSSPRESCIAGFYPRIQENLKTLQNVQTMVENNLQTAFADHASPAPQERSFAGRFLDWLRSGRQSADAELTAGLA